MTDILATPAERRLARELAEIRSALDTIKDSQRATQLGHSTLYGNLTARDPDGTVRGVIGVQADGTWAQVAQNGPPPDRPSTPIATPSMGGAVITWNGQLVSGRPADLLHVQIYVSQLGAGMPCDATTFVGTLSHAGDFPVGPLDPGVTYWCKFRAASTTVTADGSPLLGTESFATSFVPGQVVAAAVIAGIIDDLALAAEAVTNAKLAANAVDGTKIAPDSIASPHIVAQAIQALHVAADAIQAGAIAADVITGRELRALSILAEHINANAIDAGHLQAGIIDADKLAAVLVLATRIILGDPTGARMELDSAGLDQYDVSGARTLQFGADPAGGNFLTILDPANPSAALASIADTGVITAQSFRIAGSLGYQGAELSEQFAALPKGVITWGQRFTGDYTTGMTGIGELEVLGKKNRVYRIGHSACFVEPATVGGQPTTQGEMRLHYTLDGSRPTTSSAVLGTTGRSAPGDYGGLMANFGQVITGDSEVRIRVLITYQSHFGLSSRFITGGYDNGLLFWIEDMGPALPAGGVSSSGGGTGASATATYTREWTATWSRSWTNGGAALRFSNGEMVQGYLNDGVNGDQMSAFGFDDAVVRAALTGATIDAVALYLYAHHWYWNSGGQARIRTHNSAPTDTYPTVSGTIASPTLGKPEGRWVTLPTAVGDGFKNGTIKGFALDARDLARNLLHYGRFDGIGWGSPPRLRVTFRAAGTGGGTGGGTVDTGLATPSNFTATWNTTGPTVTVNWTATPGSDSTEVHEFLVDPNDTLKATVGYPTGTRTSGNLTGSQYLYAVRARKGTSVSAFTMAIRISATGQSTETAPGGSSGGGGGGSTVPMPTNHVLTYNSGTRVATNTWTLGAGVDSTEVHEFLVDPANTLKATIAAPGTQRVSGTLAGGREYLYAVRSVKAGAVSGFSDRWRIKADGTVVNEGGAETGGGTGGGGTGGGGTVDTTTAAGRFGWGTPIAGDEFGYSGAPNSTIWSMYNGPGHDGNGARVPGRATVDGSKLVGTGLANGDSFGMSHKFDQQYGRWEVRCRSAQDAASNGNDYHPVLIIWPESGEWPEDGEYDFLENSKPGEMNPEAYIHYPHDASASIQQIHVTGPAVDLTQFHNFAIQWTSSGISLYCDGVQWGSTMSGGANSVRRDIQSMPSGALTIQLDNFDGTSQTPARFEVEWVRVYSLTPQGGGGTGGGGGGTPTSGTPANPGQALWIGDDAGKNHYNIGIAESTSSHVDHSSAEIEGGFSSQWFQLSPDKQWVIFKVRIDGATTSSGTKYPRSELRELAQNSVDKAAWNGSSGTHTLEHLTKIMHVPPNKPSVCFSQIHDASSDLARLQTEASGGGLKLVLRNTPPGSSSETVRTVQAAYTIGANVTVKWSVINGNGTLVVNGASYTFPAGTSGCYFKYGSYAQTNETIDSASETCEVWVQKGTSKTWHTGYAANTTPVYTG